VSSSVIGKRSHVLYNALPLAALDGGVGTYIRELLRCMPAVVDARLTAAVQSDALEELPLGIVPAPQRPCHGWRRVLAGAQGFGHSDLFHGLDVDIPLWSTAATVSTVHDLAIFDAPWAFPRHRVLGERIILGSSLRRADAVIAVSHFTAERVKAHFAVDCQVIHEAPSPDMAPPAPNEVVEARATYDLPARFVLHVGNIEPRKDIVTLAEACRVLRVPLVITGQSLWSTRAPGDAIQLGYVPRAHLPALFCAATVVVYASRYEGFGLPPLEAMACGAVVVSTAVPAIREIIGEQACTFPAGDVDSLAAILRELIGDSERRRILSKEARKRVEGLSWRRVAEATAQVYRSLGIVL